MYLGPTNDPAIEISRARTRRYLGHRFLPLLRVLLESLDIHDSSNNVPIIAEPETVPSILAAPTYSTTSGPPDEPSPGLLCRLHDRQRQSFLCLWDTVPSHIRRIGFALNAIGWDSIAIDTVSTTLTDYTGVFSYSKLDYDECSLRPFEIDIPLGRQPIQSRPYRLNSVHSKQVNVIHFFALLSALLNIPHPRGRVSLYAF